MKRKSQDFPGDLGPILLISELVLGNNLMVQFHHLVRLGHSRLRVVTAAASMPVKSRILRVVYTLPVVVALTSALVVTVSLCQATKKFLIQSHCQTVGADELSI